jgi:HD-GYP domain-containing protein (c-di-GMP phosphodiesterase class II)
MAWRPRPARRLLGQEAGVKELPVVGVGTAIGRTLGAPVKDAGGRVLLHAGVQLTPVDARRLKDKYGITHVVVRNEVLPDLPLLDRDLEEHVRSQAIRAVGSTMDSIRKRTPVSSVPILQAAESVLDSVLRADGVPMALTILRTKDDALLQHSVNTAAYSVLIGLDYGFSRSELLKVTLGGLLHDLGKSLIPSDILLKPGRLTPEEFAIMQTHCELGRKAIQQDLPSLPPHVAAVAYQHHERMNASGYPRGLSGNRIHLYARIVAVADVFDALCAVRVYKPSWPPHRAAQYLREHPELFDAEAVRRFLLRVAIYPAGTLVRLGDWTLAVVLDQSPGRPEAPVVLAVADAHNTPLSPPRVMDLAGEGRQGLPIRAVLRRWPSRLQGQLDVASCYEAATAALAGRPGETHGADAGEPSFAPAENPRELA